MLLTMSMLALFGITFNKTFTMPEDWKGWQENIVGEQPSNGKDSKQTDLMFGCLE